MPVVGSICPAGQPPAAAPHRGVSWAAWALQVVDLLANKSAGASSIVPMWDKLRMFPERGTSAPPSFHQPTTPTRIPLCSAGRQGLQGLAGSLVAVALDTACALYQSTLSTTARPPSSCSSSNTQTLVLLCRLPRASGTRWPDRAPTPPPRHPPRHHQLCRMGSRA